MGVSIIRKSSGVPSKMDSRPIRASRKSKIVQRDNNFTLFRNTQKSWYNIFMATPCTGLVRIEWALSRFNMMAPCNFGQTSMICPMPACAPLGYLVADAQNVICKEFLNQNADWLFLVEEDNLLPPDTIMILDEYIRSKKYPLVSGLYFTKSVPAEPMVYRGRSNGYYADWKIGDKVMVDGLPTGCLMIHRDIISQLWNNSPEYLASNVQTRRVFHTPAAVWHDLEKGWQLNQGTSDLEICSRIINEGVLAQCGWKSLAKEKYPFVVDTRILSMHINQDGQQFPSESELNFWRKKSDGKTRNKDRKAVRRDKQGVR